MEKLNKMLPIGLIISLVTIGIIAEAGQKTASPHQVCLMMGAVILLVVAIIIKDREYEQLLEDRDYAQIEALQAQLKTAEEYIVRIKERR